MTTKQIVHAVAIVVFLIHIVLAFITTYLAVFTVRICEIVDNNGCVNEWSYRTAAFWIIAFASGMTALFSHKNF